MELDRRNFLKGAAVAGAATVAAGSVSVAVADEAAELSAALPRFLEGLDSRERAVFLRRYWWDLRLPWACWWCWRSLPSMC